MNADILAKALEDIRINNLSIRKAAAKYGLRPTTLHDRLKGKRLIGEKSTKMGPDPYLTSEEEANIAQWCADLCKCGFPLKTDDLLNTVQKIIKDSKRKTPFKNDRPGKTWMRSFMKRNPFLAMREAENISKGRAAVTQESILKWFRDLKDYLKSINQENIMNDPSRILNGDESSFCLCPKTGKIIAPRGYKNIYQICAGSEKETLTVLIVFSADGKLFDPMVVFPYMRPPKDIVESMPKSWFLGKSESGWMRSETFFEYVANGVHNRLLKDSVERPVILFVDGHKSHLTLELSEFCAKEQIILYALPPNTTHIMQPADVSVFKPLKSDWKHTVREWQSKNMAQALTKSKFCPLLNEAIMKNKDIVATIQNGFRKCGLYPFNPAAVDFSKCVKNNAENLVIAHVPQSVESNQSLGLNKFHIAAEVIGSLSEQLQNVGVDAEVVIKVIENESSKVVNNPPISTSSDILINTTVEGIRTGLNDLSVGVYVLNNDGTLEKETQKATEENMESIINLTKSDQNRQTETSRAAENETVSHSSPTCDQSEKAPSESNRNSPSNILATHLYYPKLTYFGGKKNIKKEGECKTPSAISSEAWRTIFAKKEKEKQDKIDAVQKRKEQRIKKKESRKVSSKQKNKKVTNKEHCQTCGDELQSDIEDDDLKNIGCDTCIRWFHLKCTSMAAENYEIASNKDYICNYCCDDI